MKKALVILLLISLASISNSQQRIIDSIKQQMPTSNDTLMLVWSKLLAVAYFEVNNDSIPVYTRQYLEYCKKLNFALQEADALRQTADDISISSPGNAIDLLFTAHNMVDYPANKNLLPFSYLKMLEVPAAVINYEQYRTYLHGKINLSLGIINWLNNRHKKSIDYFQKSLETALEIQAPDLIVESYIALGILTKNEDSSIYYLKKSRQLAIENGLWKNEVDAENFMAQRYASKKDFRSELFYRQSSLQKNILHGRLKNAGWSYVGMADYYSRSVKIKDSVLSYARKALITAEHVNEPGLAYWSAMHLSEFYKANKNKDSAYKYLELLLQAKEKIASDHTSRQFEETDYMQQMKRSSIEAANQRLRNKIKTNSFLAGLIMLLLLAFIFWRNAKRRKKEFLILQEQKTKTDQAIMELKSTQHQLIQSEKMASLGELTAGIAHEIQNPLNFVNNFSEVNKELIDEMKEEIKAGKSEGAIAIANDIKENEEKINHHGKRADAIVKNMLQHSRSRSALKEPTDINKLANEYLRLAYHGLRAKDNSFNAILKTDFEESIGNINIIPQDVGRVILNLITNAFYAVTEKKRQIGDSYEPTVSVSTKKVNGKLEITIADNGNGIPQKILDKIFQPFFTTKPTGQGTGLGLSLAYDIVKVHGGDINVNTKEGEFAEFVIQLPIHKSP